MSLFVEVALPVPMRQAFSYRVKEADLDKAQVGVRVRVPFGRQQLIGLVTGLSQSCDLAPNQIKSVITFLDHEGVLPPSLYKLTQWAARYYFCSLGQMLSQALPVALRKGAEVEAQQLQVWRVTAAGQEADIDLLKRAPAQRKLLLALLETELSQDELNALEQSKTALKALVERGWIECIERRIESNLSWRDGLELDETPHQLNPEQAIAVAMLNQQQGYHCTLLEGITGSGKTEVYLALLETVLKQGKQALILVPEIGLTPQTISRFKRQIGRAHV